MTSPFEFANRLLPSAAAVATDGGVVAALVFESVESAEEGVDNQHSQHEAEWNARIAALEQQLRTQAAALGTQLDDARRIARAEMKAEAEREFTERLVAESVSIAHLAEEFAKERVRYFAAVEVEVVKLSLAIAGRVLHREAKMEPLVLSGAVRVALEQIQGNGEAILHVPEGDLGVWRKRFHLSGAALRIMPDGQMQTGTCVLETPVGTVNFGLETQLAEIERGFFDLLQHRPV
jgi:flagellar assembly protein FliH